MSRCTFIAAVVLGFVQTPAPASAAPPATDWKKLVADLLLIDKRIDAAETEFIRSAVLADGVVSQAEVEFLVNLRKAAPGSAREFHEFVLNRVVKESVMKAGVVKPKLAELLDKIIAADGVTDDLEQQLLKDLQNVPMRCREFDELVRKYVK